MHFMLTPVEVQEPLLYIMVSVHEHLAFFCIFFIIIDIKLESHTFDIFFDWKNPSFDNEFKHWKHFVKQIIYVIFVGVIHAVSKRENYDSFWSQAKTRSA